MRYIVLVLLNTPIVALALVSFITKYKLGRLSKQRFKFQMFLWAVILFIIVSSFPIYNILSGKHPLYSADLSYFDIIQTTAIVLLIYTVNNQRQKVEQADRKLRDIHQELSIKLSKPSSGKD